MNDNKIVMSENECFLSDFTNRKKISDFIFVINDNPLNVMLWLMLELII